MTFETKEQYSLRKVDSYWVISFEAMASPCEVLVSCDNVSEAEELASLAFVEAIRIEKKFSRYLPDNIVYAINNSEAKSVALDQESAQLLKYAGECYALSEGLFDITSGILRKAWVFKGQEVKPNQALISSLLESVGWDKVNCDENQITMLPGMQIDLGGIGKEYAVDRVAQMLFGKCHKPLMVNFGGDIRVMGPESQRRIWNIGVEDPAREADSVGLIELTNGAVATSGDSRRFCLVKGKRLGHILNPRTGWPVENSPRSVTVIANFCMEAGFLTTLAMLQGAEAEEFLKAQGVKYHCMR